MRLTAALGLALALLLVGCGQQSTGPTAQEFSSERKARSERLAARTRGPQRSAVSQAEPTGATLGAVDVTFRYDPEGKRDPFRSAMWDKAEHEEDTERGPLEQFDVGQLSLVAVVWSTGNPRALVQDPSGQSYIVSEGAKIGKNEGRVTGIADNLVVVKETYVDLYGQETTKDVELRIRRSQGG